MTRSIQLHPFSVLVGLGIAVLAFVTMGQSYDCPVTRVEVVNPVHVAPHPRDFVQIEDSGPYTVPTGKIFTVTALGTTGGTSVFLLVDGQQKLLSILGGAPLGMQNVPGGLTVPAGSVITVTGPSTPPSDGQVWGYLTDQ